MIKTPKPVLLKLDEIEENPLNPREISGRSKKGLEFSLEEFGMLGELVWNKRTKRLISGNKRLASLKERGVKEAYGYIVDLDEEREIALMLAMNNEATQGAWVPEETKKRLDEIEGKMPHVYDNILLMDLRSEINKKLREKEPVTDEGVIPTMEIQPYEHWDYIVLVFKDSRDWLVACNFFGIKKAKYETFRGHKKVGLGRAVRGERFLEMVGKK